MGISKRREEIANVLLVEGKVRVGELSKRFGVTTETIRKDLIFLETEGMIKKNNGSAEVRNGYDEFNYMQKSQSNIERKQEIAACAAKLIPEGATIMLDAGSTTYQLARQLVLRKDIVVVTNFLPIAEVLYGSGVHVVVAGGEVRQTSGAMVGAFARHCIGNINADIAFLSASGFKGTDGPCVENFPEADIKECMLKHASVRYLLADSSKASVRAMIRFAQWEELDAAIIDKEIDDHVRLDLESRIEVILA